METENKWEDFLFCGCLGIPMGNWQQWTTCVLF